MHTFSPYCRIAGFYINPDNEIQKQHILAERKLMDFQIFFIKEGYGELHFKEETISLSKNNLYLIQPNRIHSYNFTDVALYYVHFDLFNNPFRNETYVVPAGKTKFNPSEKKLFQQRLDEYLKESIPSEAKLDNPKLIERKMKRITELDQKFDITTHIETIKILCELIEPFIKDQKNKNDNVINSKLVNIINFFNANIHRPLTLKEMAAAIHLSPHYFAHKFKELYNESPCAYHNQLRVLATYDQIKEGKLNISQIAQLYGYDNIYNFSRAFKKIIGKSPSKFSKK
ncbi:MAG: hypothetical protein COA79_08060 [Planctomycetota bacterium]|nr:MAG: hypothetical protein COA79_08060 [Planctomycetota bacterium]